MTKLFDALALNFLLTINLVKNEFIIDSYRRKGKGTRNINNNK